MTAPKPPVSRAADLRGAARLATDATAGITGLVEAMHERIARVPGIGRPSKDGRTSGITGFVYGTVRGVTKVVGGGVDGLLQLLAPALGSAESGPQREAIVAALNGVLGDHLVATSNPLATPMSLRVAAPATGKIVVLVHGLCMNDLQWLREGHDHGAALARDAGYTPVYVRYNTGRHISENGRELASQLERLLATWPVPVERLVLLGHSMGGLVSRSAVHHATQAGQRWPSRLSDMAFLGAPHHGAPLERAGNWVDLVLGATPYAAPFARLGQVRSAGITDLRHGNLADEDWREADRFARGPDQRLHLPLPEGVRCYALAATIGRQDGDVKDRLLGDGLVPLDSALGRHADPARTLAFPADRQWTGHRMNHLELLNRPEAYAALKKWLA